MTTSRLRLPTRARTAVLAVHVLVSVGWFGIVLVRLALAVTAAVTDDPALAVAAYRVMDVPVTLVTRPAAAAALGTGVVLALGTHWGLVRHRWVVTKAVLTVGAIVAGSAWVDGWSARALASATGDAAALAALPGLSFRLQAAGTAILAALAAASVLSTAKPWGRTAHGRGVAAARRAAATARAPVRAPGPTGPSADVH